MIDYKGTIIARASDGKPFEIVRRTGIDRLGFDEAWIAESTNPKYPETITITRREIGSRSGFPIRVPNEALLSIVRPIVESAAEHGTAYAVTGRGNRVKVERVEEPTPHFEIFGASGSFVFGATEPEAIARKLATWEANPW